MVRGEDGVLRAFLNVCRHRGAQLCPTAEGQTRTLQCRYHAWTYGLDGRLLRAPGLQDSADFDRGAFGLVPVALDTWEGLVWVNLAENPPPLTEQILPQIAARLGDAGRLTAYRIGTLAVARSDRVRGPRQLEGRRRELHGVLPLRADAPGAGAAPAGLPERRDAGVRARHAPGRRRGVAHGERAGAGGRRSRASRPSTSATTTGWWCGRTCS